MKLLTFDPSGNWGKEGSGVSGWAFFENRELKRFGLIKSENFPSQEEYFVYHWMTVVSFHPDLVLMESYKLQGHKALAQSGSSLATPRLIGYLQMKCWENEIPVQFQDPKDKIRVNDEQLVKMGILEHRKRNYYYDNGIITNHARDAFRHGVYWYKFGGGKDVDKDVPQVR